MKKALKKWVRKKWGPRCAGRCPSCALCRAWDAYDYLTCNDKEQPKCCSADKECEYTR